MIPKSMIIIKNDIFFVQKSTNIDLNTIKYNSYPKIRDIISQNYCKIHQKYWKML